MLKNKKILTHPEFGEISVEYSPRRFRVALSIAVKENVPKITLKLPAQTHFEPEKYFSFISENSSWIRKKIAELEKKTVVHTYTAGDIFYYLGKPCPLVQDTAAFFDGVEFHITAHSPQLVKRELEKIYRTLAKNHIPVLCHEYAGKFGLTIGEIRINSAEKRWGSCNSKGDLNFSWHLMTKSDEFVRYTICHELAHRIHMNHSKAFYATLKRFYPAPPPTE